MRVEIDFPPQLVEAVAQRAAELVRADSAAAVPPSPYMTVAEAAEYLRCDRHRIYDLLSARRLSKRKDGSRVLVLLAELDSYVAQSLPTASQRRMDAGVRG